MGEMSAARTTIAGGREEGEDTEMGDFRRALTTSLTPRLRVLCFAAIAHQTLAVIRLGERSWVNCATKGWGHGTELH